MKLTTEYLIVVERASAEALYNLCNTADDFARLLKADPSVEVRPGKIRFRGQYEFSMNARVTEIAEKKQRFFYLRLEHEGEEERIGVYSELLRAVRRAVGGSGGHIETLWDDVSLHFSMMSYPLIHASESLLRKLIAYFMVTTIGKEWVTETSPTAFKDALAKSKRKQYVDVLHQVDFIQLGDFLFRAYSTKDFADAFAILNNAKTPGDVDIGALKECIPRSNWERYFSKLVECTSEHLDKSWKDLYDLRCIVAHNALVSKQDYDRIVLLTDDINKYLHKALDNLDKVHVSAEERDVVAEQAIVTVSETWREFLSLWRALEAILLQLGSSEGLERHVSLTRVVKELAAEGLIDEQTANRIRFVQRVRNALVHGVDEPPSDSVLAESISILREILAALRPGRRWKDDIADAIRASGGQATLAQIYAHVEEATPRELPENWKAVVRYTLQLNSSDTATFARGGGEDIFRHVGTGVWSLRNP